MKKDMKKITLVGVDGKGNETDVLNSVLMLCMSWFDFGRVIHVSGSNQSGTQNGIETIGFPSMSYIEYNKFCLYDLPDMIDTEYCLLVHSDGFIVNPHLWDESFLQYDYIGAPWYISETQVLPWLEGSKNIVGNGGFCIRSRKFLEYSKSFVGYDGTRNEDVFLCIDNYEKALEHGIRIADTETAARFSVEILSSKYPNIRNSFGFHGKHNMKEAVEIVNGRTP